MQPVIQVENLSKLYELGTARSNSLKESIQRWWSHVKPETFWALKDISFEIQAGEVIGVIGRNGAGKSTLLKILSRITAPTTGRAVLRGRVASLLEVGTGFHPDLTGRENIYMNGAILGMRRWEINRKFRDIVEFSEVEKFIDMPVKHFSSGMYMRLAFSIAAHLDPEILLIDEVLAVGDFEFQEKCLGEMQDLSQNQGKTVLFVSHNLHAISVLTQKAIHLENGRMRGLDRTPAALRQYRMDVGAHAASYANIENHQTGVRSVHVTTSREGGIHQFGEPLTFEFEIFLKKKPRLAGFSFQIVDEQLRPVVHQWIFEPTSPWAKTGLNRLRFQISSSKLFIGKYSLATWLADKASNEIFENLQYVAPFEVVMDGVSREYEWRPGDCVYIEEGKWSVQN